MVCRELVGGKMHVLTYLFGFSPKIYCSAVSVVVAVLSKEVLSVVIQVVNQALNVLVQRDQIFSIAKVSVLHMDMISSALT